MPPASYSIATFYWKFADRALNLSCCSWATAAEKNPIDIIQIQVLSLNPKTHFIAPSQTGMYFTKKTCQVAKKAKNPSQTQTAS